MIERIEELRGEAEQAIAAASSSEALEELRVRYLGRKAELPQMLRGVAELAPEQRGAVGKAANQARQALEALIEARAGELGGEELERRLQADRVDVTLPGAPPQPVGRLHVLTSHAARAGRHLPRPRLHRHGGPRGRDRPLQLRRAQPQPDASRAGAHRHVLRRARHACALVLRTHTSPMQVRAMEAHPPPLYVVIPGRVYRPDSDATHTPQFHQIEGWPSTRTSRSPTSRARCWRSPARCSATSATCACGRTSSRSPSRASRSTCRASTAPARASCATARAATCARARAGWRCSAPGEVDPNVYAHVPTTEANAPGL